MPRYKLTLEYDGTGFCGWQRQAQGVELSIQGALEAAIAAFAGETVSVHGAGRTDAGVHAAGQVAHVDLARDFSPKTIRDATNAHVRPHRIAVLDVEAVEETFHARFCAVRRHYRYRICNRRAPPALDAAYLWHIPYSLDAQAMNDAAQVLIGRHDFTTFRASECQAKSPVKTLEALSVRRIGEEIQLLISARSFLHHQVRSITGSLCKVGSGAWTADDLQRALKARARAACGPVAPAHGLCLTSVDYGVAHA